MVLIVVVTQAMCASKGGGGKPQLDESVSGVVLAQKSAVIHGQQLCRMSWADGLDHVVVFA